MNGNSYLNKNNLRFSVFALSVIIGFFADIKCINWALVYGGFVGEGLMNVLYPIVIALILLFTANNYIRNLNSATL